MSDFETLTMNTLTVVGSEDYNVSKTMQIFDLRCEKWTKVENFDCDRIEFSAVLLENKLMLIGGINKEGIAVNTVQSYDLSTGTMENLPPMKYARRLPSAVEFKGRVYAIGGFNKTPLAYVEMWDPVLKTWKELAPMSIPRGQCEASVLGEEIFVVGGFDNKNDLSDTDSYNPDTDKWTKRASMNENRFGFGMSVIGGYLYAVGGTTRFLNMLKTVERYDHKIDKWKTIHSLEIGKWGLGAGKLSGKLVIVGGSTDEKILSTMEMYDDENDKWISMPSLNEPRCFFRAVEIPWRLAEAVLLREIPK